MEEDKVELHLVGKITSDVEVRTSAKGTSWLSILVESNCNGYKSFNKLMAYKKTAEDLAANARKGKRIKILGNASSSKNSKTGNFETNLTIYKFKVLDDVVEEPLKQSEPKPKQIDIPQDNGDDLPF